MEKYLLLILSIFLSLSCGNKRGELIGVKQKKWFPEKPYGMTLIEGGAFIMGKQDDDIAQLKNATAKTVTVRSFYMDETEITNSEYRQFVHWVRDSIALSMLARKSDELNQGEETSTEGIGEYAFKDADTADQSPFQKYMRENYYDLSDDPYAGRPLNWDQSLEWDPNSYTDEAYVEVMDSLYLPPEVWYNGEMKIDVNKLIYKYSWFDAEAASLERAKNPQSRDRLPFIKKEEIEIYPDTTVWIKDFNYSYNEPMHNDYFSHPAYQDYPVVGISWKQAVAFCNWRTHYKNSYQKEKNKPLVNNFRLPTEAEWEYAARGGIPAGTYPWGSPYLLNDRGCFLANFKPLRGDYASDQAVYAVEAKSFLPNDYNLYNMSGNVAEWTESSYDPGAYEYVSSLNPNMSLNDEKRKVVRGGSWKDVAYFLRVSSRDYEYQDTARSYIGFRTVQDYLGSEKIKIK
tara:strand:- start:38 stop:1411 length:1374 start_codon:yes stop_codon:yes gene_type:complete